MSSRDGRGRVWRCGSVDGYGWPGWLTGHGWPRSSLPAGAARKRSARFAVCWARPAGWEAGNDFSLREVEPNGLNSFAKARRRWQTCVDSTQLWTTINYRDYTWHVR